MMSEVVAALQLLVSLDYTPSDNSWGWASGCPSKTRLTVCPRNVGPIYVKARGGVSRFVSGPCRDLRPEGHRSHSLPRPSLTPYRPFSQLQANVGSCPSKVVGAVAVSVNTPNR